MRGVAQSEGTVAAADFEPLLSEPGGSTPQASTNEVKVASDEVVSFPAASHEPKPSLPDKNPTYEAVEGQLYIQGKDDVAPISYNDVRQGQIGDCYLMASIAAIARQNPKAIANLIKDNGNGTYTMNFHARNTGIRSWFDDFSEAKVTVSGKLPVDNKQLIYARAGDTEGSKQELWVALVEKGFAQLHSSYAAIGKGGDPAAALEALTGNLATTRNAKNVTIEQLDASFKAGKAIVIATPGDGKGGGGKGPLFDNKTLVSSHAYWVKSVDAKQGTVTLENPWGAERDDIVLKQEELQKHFANTYEASAF